MSAERYRPPRESWGRALAGALKTIYRAPTQTAAEEVRLNLHT